VVAVLAEPGAAGVLAGAVETVAGLVSGFDPAVLSGSDARRMAELFARGEKLCAAGKLLAAQRVADTSAWAGGGARNPEEWLAGLSGVSVGAATSALDTAERLAGLPVVAQALRTGEVSVDQAVEISHAASGRPAVEARLVATAGSGASMRALRQQCRHAANATAEPAADRARHQRLIDGRYLRTWVDSDGAGRGQFSLPPVDYARLLACLRPFQDRAFQAARAAGRRESPVAYSADALVAMAQAAHRSGPGQADRRPPRTSTIDPGPMDPADPACDPAGPAGPAGPVHPACDSADSACDPAGPAGPTCDSADSACDPAVLAVRPPATIIGLVDLAALRRGAPADGETCEIVGVGPVPLASVQELMDDAFFAAAITDGTDVRRVVHLGRRPLALQRTALWVRDRACVHCGSLHNLEIDHTDQWSGTRRTTLDQLAFLCRRCHHLKTHKGWRLVGTPGHFRLIEPDPHPPPPRP
jgi:hypothetical protein